MLESLWSVGGDLRAASAVCRALEGGGGGGSDIYVPDTLWGVRSKHTLFKVISLVRVLRVVALLVGGIGTVIVAGGGGRVLLRGAGSGEGVMEAVGAPGRAGAIWEALEAYLLPFGGMARAGSLYQQVAVGGSQVGLWGGVLEGGWVVRRLSQPSYNVPSKELGNDEGD